MTGKRCAWHTQVLNWRTVITLIVLSSSFSLLVNLTFHPLAHPCPFALRLRAKIAVALLVFLSQGVRRREDCE